MSTLSFNCENGQHARAIEWLSTSIIHDLRNPVATIYAAAEILIDIDAGSTQAKRLAANIFKAADHMRALLADLNSMAGGNQPMAERCVLREIIAAAAQAAAEAKQNFSVHILIEMPELTRLPLIRYQMERVFFNLISNALEVMPTGGKLHIASRTDGNNVLIYFEDTGPGIPKRIRDRLFEPFVTAGKPNGLGLGLALSRQAILDHGGDIWTEPASGARFVIRLPLNH